MVFAGSLVLPNQDQDHGKYADGCKLRNRPLSLFLKICLVECSVPCSSQRRHHGLPVPSVTPFLARAAEGQSCRVALVTRSSRYVDRITKRWASTRTQPAVFLSISFSVKIVKMLSPLVSFITAK
jgi:hypothetical protein